MAGLSLGTAIALITELSLRNVPSDLVFASATARDTFFATNANRLNNGLTVVINSTTSPELQIYRGQAGQPYDNTQWTDITGVIRGPRGLKGDAGELSGDNLLYVSASASPPISNPDGSRTAPFATVQDAINALMPTDAGVEVIDGSTYVEDLTITDSIRIFAPSANLTGDITITDGEIVNIYMQEITGTIDQSKLIGFYRNDGKTVLSAGDAELDVFTELVNLSQDLEVGRTIYIGGQIDAPNTWRITRNNQVLQFSRYEQGQYVERATMGSSVTTDRFILEDTSGNVIFLTNSDEPRTLIKPSIDGAGAVLGNPLGRVGFVNDGSLENANVDNSAILANNVQTGTGESQNGITSFNFTVSTTFSYATLSGTISLANVPADTRCRFELRNADNNQIIAINSTIFDFNNNDGGTVVVNGLNQLDLIESIVITNAFNLEVRLFFNNAVDIQGATTDLSDGRGSRFVPHLIERYYATNISDVATNQNVVNLIEAKTGDNRLSFRNLKDRSRDFVSVNDNLTISSANIETYRNNALLYINDVPSYTLVLTDGAFSEDDELMVVHYPSANTGQGTVTIQAGETGTINGSNSLTLLRDTTVTIKHITGDDWVVINRMEHPITVRRDTPTIPMMRSLLEASVNGNSAFWFVANDQITANEQGIDDTILIQALRDDLLDLNGNPIPTIATQKNTTPILLEAGTMCRIFQSIPTQSVIRVVFTPQRSSSISRIETETNDLTITSTNVPEYRGNLILFTNTTGIRTLTISDDIFDVNDEITIKHFTTSPNVNVGVNITQQGTGAEIDGLSTIELRGNTSMRLKYINNNKWRILSSHGLSGGAPVPIVPEVHNFSIDMPSRIDVNPAIDTINTSHIIDYSISNHSLVTSIRLYIGSTIFNLTTPTQEGLNTETIMISGIDLSSAQNYNTFLELNNDSGLRSNIQVLRVQNLPQNEAVYWGFSATNTPDIVDVSTFTIDEVNSEGDTFDMIGSFPTSEYLIILVPSNHDISKIFSPNFPATNFRDTFDRTPNVRTISAIQYNSYTIQNEGSTGQINYRAEVL